MNVRCDRCGMFKSEREFSAFVSLSFGKLCIGRCRDCVKLYGSCDLDYYRQLYENIEASVSPEEATPPPAPVKIRQLKIT